jgi:hypothetical protein
LFYGCLIAAAIVLAVVVGGGIAAYYFAKGQLNAYTDPQPAAIPVVEAPPAEVAATVERVEGFAQAVQRGQEAEDLSLSADDLNLLVASDPQLKGRVHFQIADGKISAQVSIPTDFLPAGVGVGRFFNAEASLHAGLENGLLTVSLIDAKVKGQSLPAVLLDTLRQENLAQEIASDPEVARVLERFERIRVEGDRVVLRLRRGLPLDPGGDRDPKASP